MNKKNQITKDVMLQRLDVPEGYVFVKSKKGLQSMRADSVKKVADIISREAASRWLDAQIEKQDLTLAEMAKVKIEKDEALESKALMEASEAVREGASITLSARVFGVPRAKLAEATR